MEQTNEDIKDYVVCEKTLQELADLGEVGYVGEKIFEYKNEREDLSEEQKELQRQYRWRTEQMPRMRLYQPNIVDIIEGVIDKVVLSKYRGVLYPKVLDEVMKTKLTCYVTIKPLEVGNKKTTEVSASFTFPYVKHDDNRYDSTYEPKNLIYGKTDELTKELDEAKLRAGYGASEDFVYLESFAYLYDQYCASVIKKIPQTLTSLIRKKLTYCLKGGQNIVPDEYLDKGKAGIDEWQSIKRAGNKNNSMEKKMLAQCLRDKKQTLYNDLKDLSREIVMNQDWTLPSLAINGMYNQACMWKLTRSLLKDKKNQEIIDLSEEYMLEMAKKHWKEKLEEAIKKIDNFKK